MNKLKALSKLEELRVNNFECWKTDVQKEIVRNYRKQAGLDEDGEAVIEVSSFSDLAQFLG